MPSPSPDPVALLRSRSYVGLLVFAGVLGVPISAAAYGFLALLSGLQEWAFTDLPRAVGFQETPLWWPLPPLTVAGVVVGLTIRSLPGKGGHSPADGLATSGAPTPIELPGVVVAALASIGLGVVLGPEAPLIALGGGLAGWAVRLARRDAPAQATAVVAAAGSFAAISTLLGSPLLGAFLLMEASGLAGPTLGLVLVPGLVAAGVGSLIFIGLDAWTGLGTFSLALPDLPPFARPDLAQFGWALAIGLLAAVVGTAIDDPGPPAGPVLERQAGAARLGPHDLRDHHQDDVRRVVLLAAQEPHVFNSTIRENVAFARPGASDAEVREALTRARLGAWVVSLPAGLGTRVGEGGRALSGGQRQRLALARAFLADPAVLVLDEPDAHLDAETVAALLGDLWREAGERSVLLLTHGRTGPFERCRRLELRSSSHRGDATRGDLRLHVR
jgi:predicted ABC-type transport system involved in lysophospholipase L1 biosynthesis ATPase subunit